MRHRIDRRRDRHPAAFEMAGFYRLEPERVTLIDNTRGFGHKETLDI